MTTTQGLIIAIALIPVTMGIALMVCVQLHPLRLDRWRPATLNVRYLGGACRKGCVREIVIVGIDGSPSCAVSKTLDFHGFDLIATVPVESITVEKQNTILRECVKGGRGIFIDELQKELKRRRINVPYLAHDLLAELDGKKSNVELGGADSA